MHMLAHADVGRFISTQLAPAGTPDPDMREVDRIRRLGGPLLAAP